MAIGNIHDVVADFGRAKEKKDAQAQPLLKTLANRQALGIIAPTPGHPAETKEPSMSKADATPSLQPIPEPRSWYDKKVQHTVGMFNAMIHHDLLHLFPPNLTAAAVRKELMAAVAGDQARGKARGTYHISVEDRRAIEAEAAPVFTRVTSLIEGGMPIGTAGRANYFPVDNANPTEGDLLVSYGIGTAKHGWPRLPNGWTAEYLQGLGTRLNQAQDQTDSSAAGRSGQTKASQNLGRDLAKTRTRLRQLLVGWFGTTSAELLAFGLQPRKPGPGRRAKAKSAAPMVVESPPT